MTHQESGSELDKSPKRKWRKIDGNNPSREQRNRIAIPESEISKNSTKAQKTSAEVIIRGWISKENYFLQPTRKLMDWW